jgi:hypothetical protein
LQELANVALQAPQPQHDPDERYLREHAHCCVEVGYQPLAAHKTLNNRPIKASGIRKRTGGFPPLTADSNMFGHTAPASETHNGGVDSTPARPPRSELLRFYDVRLQQADSFGLADTITPHNPSDRIAAIVAGKAVPDTPSYVEPGAPI